MHYWIVGILWLTKSLDQYFLYLSGIRNVKKRTIDTEDAFLMSF